MKRLIVLALTTALLAFGAVAAEPGGSIINDTTPIEIPAVDTPEVEARIKGSSSCSSWSLGNRAAGYCAWSPTGKYAMFYVYAICWKPGSAYVVTSWWKFGGRIAVTSYCQSGYTVADWDTGIRLSTQS